MPSEVPIYGVRETIAALKELDANAARQINTAINKSVDKVVQSARGLVDPQGLSGWGNWRGGYDASAIAKGIVKRRTRPSKRAGKVQALAIVKNTTAAGAIWELAGRRSDGNAPAGRAMVAAIRRRGGPASRTAWRAADHTDMGGVQDEIRAHVERARLLCQAAIDKAS